MYRDYKKFSNISRKLVKKLSERNAQVDQFDLLQNAALNITNKEAPVKKKHNWNNQSAFIKKEIRKAIMIRSRSLNKFFGEKA